jgi:hypothetical protein
MSRVPAAIANRLRGTDHIKCGAPGCAGFQRLVSRNNNPLAPEHMAEMAVNLGWRVGKDARLDRCPDCAKREDGIVDRAVKSVVGYVDLGENTCVYDLYNKIIELYDVDWRGNENMFTSTLIAMVAYLNQFITAHWHEMRPAYQSLLAQTLTELLDAVVKADIVEVEAAPTAPDRSEIEQLQKQLVQARAEAKEAHPITKWLDSLGEHDDHSLDAGEGDEGRPALHGGGRGW